MGHPVVGESSALQRFTLQVKPDGRFHHDRGNQQAVQLHRGENGFALGSALNLDEAARAGSSRRSCRFLAVGIFGWSRSRHQHAPVMPQTPRRRSRSSGLVPADRATRPVEASATAHAGAGDRRGAGAIDLQRAISQSMTIWRLELLQIDHRADTAADQPLDLWVLAAVCRGPLRELRVWVERGSMPARRSASLPCRAGSLAPTPRRWLCTALPR